MRTTVRQCSYAGLIRDTDARRILRHLEEDLDDGTLIHEPLDWTESLQQAESVAERLASTKPCRSLDLWHVAIALEIQADIFASFDKDQLEIAQAVGLGAVMPS